MWDNNAPLQLLKSMPKKLSKENLERIQLVIDADKYKNSLISGFDLCGIYAPFCRGCNKTSIYPCAVAYVNMMKSDGVEVEIDAQPVVLETKIFNRKPLNESVRETQVKTENKPEAEVEEEVAAATNVQEQAIQEENEEQEIVPEQSAVVESSEEEQPVKEVKPVYPTNKNTIKGKIRIAVARKKI